jgi:DNA-binding transcriptional LysR family regulator
VPRSKSHILAARKLPPLGAVRAFEAAARLGSTVTAAAELGVTHGAVSRQVKALEDWLSAPLFERRAGRLELTEAGESYASAVGHSLDMLDEATRVAMVHSQERVVRINTTASFAARWLVLRLPRFRERHPGIEIWVSEAQALVEPRSGGACDIAIRTGSGPWPGVKAEPLMDERLFPVCAPALGKRLSQPENLAGVPILHDDDPQADWSKWFVAVGLDGKAFELGPRFANSSLLLQAAVDGQGVALARERFAIADLEAGRLVRPFAKAVPIGTAYWLVLPKRGELTRSARTFCAWLREEAKSASSESAGLSLLSS